MPAFELFEILIATAESRNLTDAAQKLKLSQAAVSMKLKELDRQSPLPLFSLEGKRKVLTHYGRELYKIAKANRSSMASLYENLNREYASAETLTLRVGSRRELFEALAPKIRFPGRLQFVALSSTECVQHLLDHKIDIAISYQLPDSPEIMGKKILESSANLVVHKKFLKGRKDKDFVSDPAFLQETPSVLYLETGHLLDEWLAHHKVPFDSLRVRGIAEDWRTVQALVDEGWGYGIVPSYVPSFNPDVVTVGLSAAVLPIYAFHAIFHKDLKRIPAFKEVLEFKA
ncbi:MAG: LysR family transcriptional regulator [Bdellovibrionota bacterium]